jgi:hypothetical protein
MQEHWQQEHWQQEHWQQKHRQQEHWQQVCMCLRYPEKQARDSWGRSRHRASM